MPADGAIREASVHLHSHASASVAVGTTTTGGLLAADTHGSPAR
jgi:hypothetical protein